MSSIYTIADIGIFMAQNAMAATVDMLTASARAVEAQAMFLDHMPLCKAFANAGKLTAAQLDLSARLFHNAAARHPAAPAYDIPEIDIKGQRFPVREYDRLDRVFYSLKHFAKTEKAPTKPKLLIVAPMSGHYGSFLRSTVKALLPDHDVYMLDWKNPRDIDKGAGDFSFETYMDCLIESLRTLGPQTHVMGISQSTVPLLAASAYLAGRKDPATPASMTLIGGPIDTRASKSPLHDFVRNRPLGWFRKTVIDSVPPWYKGRGREVYPGTTQLAALMAKGSDRHREKLTELYGTLSSNSQLAAELEEFYKDYFAVMDLDKAFFLDTLRHVYRDHSLAKGTMTYRGEKIDLSNLRRTALLTIEGGKDGIALPGETHAAHDLCPNIPAGKRMRHTQPDYGHYGIAIGARFRRHIAPKITGFIQRQARTGLRENPRPKTPKAP